MRSWLQRIVSRFQRWLYRPPNRTREIESENRLLRDLVNRTAVATLEDQRRAEYMERVSELIEARQMAGSGPWRVGPETLRDTDNLINMAAARIAAPESRGVPLREATPVTAAGATGDIELALQNVEWRREINLSWLEFSRWGIQQIILISRLRYVNDPWIQRAINVSAQYVFGRGIEVMSEDNDANEVLKESWERNKRTLGLAALSELQKRCGYDGQIFFAAFSDAANSGKVTWRTIDATEILEIITDPDDTDCPWFYHRKWTERAYNLNTGQAAVNPREAYYPALGWEPKPEQTNQQTIGTHPIIWNVPVLHHKGGTGISKWHFDCPKAYAALPWSKAGRRWLEACMTVRQALAQFALTVTTKGGQQAIEGVKQQMQTTVGPTSNLWDKNPSAVMGSTFVSGAGTKLEALNSKGAGGDPEGVREYRSMVANVFAVPPTFLGDLETANLATATTLDRPTELAMLEIQERWRECLITIATFDLNASKGAASGRLREKGDFRVMECARRQLKSGRWMYEANPKPKTIQIKVIFPAIREGDMPAIVKAIVEAMTLENKGGQIVGIDERVGVGLLYEQLGVENPGDILDEQYAPGEYVPDRTTAIEPVPIGKAQPDPGGTPQLPGGQDPKPIDKKVSTAKESVISRAERLLERALDVLEK